MWAPLRLVAAARALATEDTDPIINDPFAAPLVRAVGIEFFTRVVDGDIEPGDAGVDGTAELQTETDSLAVRTRFFDEFFTDAAAAGIEQSVILAAGLDSRAYRLNWPAGSIVYEIDHLRSSRSRPRPWRPSAPSRRRSAARSASICATTGRPHCATAVSTTPNRRPGAPRDC